MKNTLFISYEHHTGGQLADNKLWMGVLNDECDVFDWDYKEGLIKSAKEYNYDYAVLRYHKKGKFYSIVEKSW